MNIVVVTPWYPSTDFPSKGVFVKNQVDVLSEQHNVYVCHLANEFEIMGKKHLSKECDKNVTVFRFKDKHFPGLGLLIFTLRLLRVVKMIARNNKIDIIHAHVTLPVGFCAVIIKKILGIPVVLTEHSSDVGKIFEKVKTRMLAGFVWKNVDIFTVVSEKLKKKISLKHDGLEIEVLPNVINTNIFAYDKKIAASSDTLEVLFVGGMDSERKGIDLLLNATANLYKEGEKKISLRLYGGGRYMHFYKELSKDLGIEHICRFYGEVPPADVQRAISGCTFLVLPSRNETFGVILVEAMACGKPVIATVCGGPEEFVLNFTGYIVEPESVDALKEAMQKMIRNITNFDAEKISAYAKKNFGREAFSSRVNPMYETLVN